MTMSMSIWTLNKGVANHRVYRIGKDFDAKLSSDFNAAFGSDFGAEFDCMWIWIEHADGHDEL